MSEICGDLVIGVCVMFVDCRGHVSKFSSLIKIFHITTAPRLGSQRERRMMVENAGQACYMMSSPKCMHHLRGHETDYCRKDVLYEEEIQTSSRFVISIINCRKHASYRVEIEGSFLVKWSLRPISKMTMTLFTSTNPK